MEIANVDFLREIFVYDQLTGRLHWKRRPDEHFSSVSVARLWNSKFAGSVVGTVDKKGYLVAKIGGRFLFCHRIIWAIVYGEWPDQVDHIDSPRSDNRLENLRSVSNHENQKNRPLQRNNKSGVSGVCRHSLTRLWEAGIGIDGKYTNLGAYPRFHDAVARRKCAEITQGYHKNHGRKVAA